MDIAEINININVINNSLIAHSYVTTTSKTDDIERYTYSSW